MLKYNLTTQLLLTLNLIQKYDYLHNLVKLTTLKVRIVLTSLVTGMPKTTEDEMEKGSKLQLGFERVR